MLASGAYLIGDAAWRFNGEEPKASAVIEIPYMIGKKALKNVYKGKGGIPAVL